MKFVLAVLAFYGIAAHAGGVNEGAIPPGYTLARIDGLEPEAINGQVMSYKVTYEIQPCAQNLISMRILERPQPPVHYHPEPLPHPPHPPPGPYHGQQPLPEPPGPPSPPRPPMPPLHRVPPFVEVVIYDNGIKCFGPTELVQGEVTLPIPEQPGEGGLQPIQPN